MVSRRDFRGFIDKRRVHAAIVAAEHETSAPIHVSLAPYFWGNVRRTAERAFRRHGLAKAPKRNGVLFFVVPARREFAVVGDADAHAALGQATWESVVTQMQQRFAQGDATAALVEGIETIGHALAAHFPP